jgi:hypothetical protein
MYGDQLVNGDPRLQLIYEEARRAVERQAARVNEVRTRASSVLAAASIVAAFLGSGAFETAPTATAENVTAWAYLAAISFVGVGVLVAWILRPRKSWVFQRRADRQLHAYLEQGLSDDIDRMRQSLAQLLHQDYVENEQRINQLKTPLVVAVVLLVLEMVAFFIDLRARG